MFRLFKLIVSCAMLAVFCWFVVTVRVGRYTLWDHARRIAHTTEAHDLADGAKDKAHEMAKEVCARVNCRP